MNDGQSLAKALSLQQYTEAELRQKQIEKEEERKRICTKCHKDRSLEIKQGSLMLKYSQCSQCRSAERIRYHKRHEIGSKELDLEANFLKKIQGDFEFFLKCISTNSTNNVLKLKFTNKTINEIIVPRIHGDVLLHYFQQKFEKKDDNNEKIRNEFDKVLIQSDINSKNHEINGNLFLSDVKESLKVHYINRIIFLLKKICQFEFKYRSSSLKNYKYYVQYHCSKDLKFKRDKAIGDQKRKKHHHHHHHDNDYLNCSSAISLNYDLRNGDLSIEFNHLNHDKVATYKE
ncbi:hypothetical protein PACTADRAFT_15835 [Pachysolen tannophilus NRRL Y-2460]|uniref:Uncharacterized protein n=1 Tax=Pachysolen tannophilus NRRL Y-2460 TaxID=669874 RepID=A0A1E4U034_PACTA|nr:hypothetical protein PACTADRAFT_15835 [Pachysolen tannophilus NRRL Y-2460]